MSDRPPTFIMCNRTGEASARPIAGSVEQPCAACRHPVMVSPVSVRAWWRARAKRPPGLRLLCVECATTEAGPAGLEVRVVPGQAEEAAANGLELAFPDGTVLRKP